MFCLLYVLFWVIQTPRNYPEESIQQTEKKNWLPGKSGSVCSGLLVVVVASVWPTRLIPCYGLTVCPKHMQTKARDNGVLLDLKRRLIAVAFYFIGFKFLG